MSVTSWLSAILVHATAAGAAVSPAITDAAIGLPIPRGRCIRVYWTGEAAPVRMGGERVLDAELVAQTIHVSAFWPVGDADEEAASNRITEMATFTHELRTRILGDSALGGAATDLEMDYATVDVTQLQGAIWAVVTTEITTDYKSYTIAP